MKRRVQSGRVGGKWRGTGRVGGPVSGLRRAASGLRTRAARARDSTKQLRDRWGGFAVLLAAGFVVLCVAAWPFALAHLQAVAVLRLVGNEPVPRLVGAVVARPVTTEEVQIPISKGTIRGRLYTPMKGEQAPSLVVLHGVHHLGIDEPRLEAFAAGMASCGLRVLTPELPDMKDYRVDQGSVQVIGEATQWFAEKTGAPVGVMGLSFSGGLALVAAADPVFRPSFKFVFAVGSQDAMGQVARYYQTGREARPNGTVELLTPHEYGPLVLEYDYLDDFVPAQDVQALRAVLRAHLYEDAAGERKAAAGLNEVQKREALELMDATSVETRARLAKAEAMHVTEMEGLSPRGKLKTLTTPVYLLHGEGDNIIPSAETLWMASELQSETLQAVLVSPVLSHLDFDGSKPGAWDEWRLVHFFALVMHAAEKR